MNAETISDPATRSQLAILASDLDAAASAARGTREAIDDAQRRRRELMTLLGDHDAIEPSAVPDAAADLSALLAANPAAASSADWAGRLEEAQAEAASKHAAWRGKRGVIERSIATVDAELPTLARRDGETRQVHEAKWAGFVTAAREAMFDELERAFPAFHDRYLAPIAALELARRIYSDGLASSGPRRTLADSRIGIMQHGGGYQPLFPVERADAGVTYAEHLDRIEQLCVSLASASPTRRTARAAR